MTMRSALVTGAAGFVGRHLVAGLVADGLSVTAVDRDAAALAALGVAVTARAGNLGDAGWMRGVVTDAKPTHVFHLAAMLGTADTAPAQFFDANVAPTMELLEVLRHAAPEAVVLLASSSAVYGDAGGSTPIAESVPFSPRTPYGTSKACQEMLAIQYFRGFGLRTIRVRAFNLVGPGLSDALLAGAVARQVAMAERDGGDRVLVGDLSARRDFLDVRDAAAAYRALAVRGAPGEVYNVCSGRAVPVSACVEPLIEKARRPLRLERDPARLRAVDVLEQVGDHRRLTDATGWQPATPLATSLQDLLDDWRRRVGAER